MISNSYTGKLEQSEEENRIITRMEKSKSKFIQALALCMREANYKDYTTLRRSFRDYWKLFEEDKDE